MLSTLVGVALATFVVDIRPGMVPRLPPIPRQSVPEGETLLLDAAAVNRELFSRLRYSLVGSVPPTMRIEEETGLITWPSHEVHGPGEFTVRVHVADADHPHCSSEADFQIAVREVHRPPSLRAATLSDLQLEDGVFSLRFTARDRDFPEGPIHFDFSLDPTPLGWAEIDTVTGVFTWAPDPADFDRTYRLTYRASKSDSAVAERQLTISLPEPGQVIERGTGLTFPYLARLLRRASLELGQADQKAFATGTLWRLTVATATLLVFEYDSARNARHAMPLFNHEAGTIAPELLAADLSTRVYHKGRLIVVTLGDHPQTIDNIRKIFGPPKPIPSRYSALAD